MHMRTHMRTHMHTWGLIYPMIAADCARSISMCTCNTQSSNDPTHSPWITFTQALDRCLFQVDAMEEYQEGYVQDG